MRLKKSNYNIIVKTYDDKTLAFNSTSCALAEVNSDFLHILENIESLDMNNLDIKTQDLIAQMKEGSFVIPEEVDEIKQIKIMHNKGRYNNIGLGFTIAPTLSCNFKCPYCYETPENTQMSEKVQMALIDMVEKYAPHIRNLGVTWYGGEPLVGKNVIWNLSKKFLEICDKNNLNYSTYMVTNGYLIDQETINKLKQFKITGFQITIDGPPEIHNKRRILRTGIGTFDVLLNNIKLLLENECEVSIRVNIDKTNVEYVEELLKILKKERIEQVSINFGQVTAYTGACASISGTCMNNKEYATNTLELQKLLHKYGMEASEYPYYPGIKANYCGADQINAFVIDPNGYMYKCWNNIGDVQTSVGNVCSLENEEGWQLRNHADWFEQTPFDSDECMGCQLLPICMGGCPYMKLSTKKLSCEKWKYNFKDILEYTYLYKGTESEG